MNSTGLLTRGTRELKRAVTILTPLAEEKGETIIVSSDALDDGYAPMFPTHKSGLTAEELSVFDEAFQRGLVMYRGGDFTGAIEPFMIANGIDGQAAILNYMLGRSYKSLGDTSLGRAYIRKSIDNDGRLQRSPDSLHRISEQVAREFSRVHYVDSVQKFEDALYRGISVDELFMDFQHPNGIGHIIIARNFLDAMSQLDPLTNFPAREVNFGRKT